MTLLTAIGRLTFGDILRAAAAWSDGVRPPGFRQAREWVVRIGDKEFPHRPLIALAIAQHKEFVPQSSHFNGSIDNACRKRLDSFGFSIEPPSRPS